MEVLNERSEMDEAGLGCEPTNAKGRNDILRQWVIYPLVGAVIFGVMACPDCFISGNYERMIISMVLSLIFWTSLWNGNGLLSDYISSKISWLEEPVKRLVYGVIALVGYTILVSLLIYVIFIEFYLDKDFLTVFNEYGYEFLKFPMLITIFIALFMHGRSFLVSWRQAAINVEKLKNQNLSSQFESLKNQVNPHFLFNSLNALSSLVYADQDKAVAFIRKLSEVYRYVLDNQFEEVVQLNEELEFLKSFIFLNKIRFGENLDVEISALDQLNGSYSIPPLTLQMLVENAIKHNVISKENKLSVELFEEEGFLYVANNLQEKKLNERPSGVGLNNIKSRYEFLTNNKVEVEKSEDKFLVKVPLLNLEK